MLIPPFKPKLPEIAESEQTPLVRGLLQIIGHQQEQIQRLEDEIRRLQGGPPRPQLKPNTLEPAGTAAQEAADGDREQVPLVADPGAGAWPIAESLTDTSALRDRFAALSALSSSR